MINGRRVTAFTPFGRELTVSILYHYMKRDHDRGLLDEWQLWMNTDDSTVRVVNGEFHNVIGQYDDVMYAYKLERENDWIKVIERPLSVPLYPKQLNTGLFYKTQTIDPGTTYLRFDDDIVYVHEDAIENMVKAKSMYSGTLAVFPIIWNNAIVSYHLQQQGIIPVSWGYVHPYCMDEVGWKSFEFAREMHTLLLKCIDADMVDKLYLHHDRPLDEGMQFSVSCFAMNGEDYCELDPPGDLRGMEEEHWLTVTRPHETGRRNVIISNAIVSHFSFFHQREKLLKETNILDRYRAIAENL